MNCSFKSLLAALILLCSTVATAHDFEVGGIFYNITSSTEKTVEVTYKGDSYSAYYNEYTGDVTVPSTIAYNGETYSVTSIGESAFLYCSGLKSVTIGDGVTSIGDRAFFGCDGLTSIEIPGSVTSIGESAFPGCDGLTSIVVDGNNRHYDSREGCNAIIETATNTLIQGCQNTIIPGSVTSIGEYAFRDCSGLTSIEIPGSVTSIVGWAFSGCSGLTSVTIGDGVTSIGGRAFRSCSGLTSIEIPGSVTSIGIEAFYDCEGLTSVTSMATTAPALGYWAFDYISSDATLYYPAGSDYSSWEQYFANIEEITEEFPEEEEVFGDLNGDGTVSVSDIQVLVNIILGN